ncbi:hypothetical protein E4U55_002627, partial [Claviceps digitariae]
MDQRNNNNHGLRRRGDGPPPLEQREQREQQQREQLMTAASPSPASSTTAQAFFRLRSPTRAAHPDLHRDLHPAASFASAGSIGSSTSNPEPSVRAHRNREHDYDHDHDHGHRHHHRAAAASSILHSPPQPALSSPLHHAPQPHLHANHYRQEPRGHSRGPSASAAARGPASFMTPAPSTPAGGAGAGPVPALLPPTSSSSSAANSHNHLQAPLPLSPRHAAVSAAAPSSSSSSSNYYPPPSASESHRHTRDKAASGRVYDPTTDTTKERRVSDAWHNAPQNSTPKTRDPHPYDRTPADRHQPSSYYANQNGNRTSPRQSYARSRSPISHSHPNLPVGSHSPPASRLPHMTSPPQRRIHVSTMNATPNGLSAMPAVIKSEPRAASPSKPSALSTSN